MKVQLELFTANVCSRCAQAKGIMTALMEELGDDQFELTFVDVIENIDHAVEMGVLVTPALAVNSKLVFSPLPGRKTVFKALKAELQK